MKQLPAEESFSRHEISPTSWQIRDSSGTIVATAARGGWDITTNTGTYRLGGGWRPGTPVKDTSDGRTAFTLSMGLHGFGKHIISSDGTVFTLRYSGKGPEKIVMSVVDDRDLTVMTLKWASTVNPNRRSFPLGEATLTGGLEPCGDMMLFLTLAFHVFQCHLQPLQG